MPSLTAALVVLLQGPASAAIAGWIVTPPHPTVGDTVWVEWRVVPPPGWRVRPVPLQPADPVEPLAGPIALRRSVGWAVRYSVVAWSPGAVWVAPPILLLGPDGQMDSITADTARFAVGSVLGGGDSAATARPQGALPPLRPVRRDPVPITVALAAALGALAAGLAWRRRGPRRVAGTLHVPVEPEVPDERWLAAGEPRAVAARAAGLVRQAIARAVPAAHPALSTEECLVTIERARPDAPLRELAAVLRALDQVGFASAHGAEVSDLARRARALARAVAS